MIGVDIAFVDRFKKIKKEDYLTWRKFYTNKEWCYCMEGGDRHVRLATIFAAKEAVFKASAGKIGSLLDIKINHEENGRPIVDVEVPDLGNFSLSISHDGDYVVAMVFNQTSSK